MMRPLEKLIPVLFVMLSFFFLKEYFLTHKVPLPFNLLVSFYSPWKFEERSGYGLSIPNKPLGNDDLRLFYPSRKFTIDEFKSGRIPLWNPYIFSGSVQHATYQTSIFYPLTAVYFLISQADAWSLLVFMQPVLTGWFTYLFLRSLKLSPASSLLGSLGFAFSGWMIAHWEEDLVILHSVLWLPLALYAFNVIWEQKQNIKGFAIFFLALIFSMLAGFPQIIMYVFGVVALWNIYKWFCHRTESNSLVRLGLVLAGLGITLISTAVQWVPAFEAYLNAPRSKVDASYLFKTFLSPLPHLVTFFVADFWGNPGTYNYFSKTVYLQERTIYVSIAVIIFALSTLFYKSKGNMRFWKIFSLITLSMGFALPTSWIWYFFRVPILSVAMPIRIFILSTFGICVLSAYGLEKFMTDRSYWVSVKLTLLISSIVFVILWGFVGIMIILLKIYPSLIIFCKQNSFFGCQMIMGDIAKKQIFSYATISLRNLFVPTTLFITLVFVFKIFRNKTKLFLISVFLISLFGSYYFAGKILYFSNRNYEYPLVPPIEKLKEISGFDRVWSYGDAYISRNILSYYHLYSPEGYESLYSFRYGRLLNTIQTDGVLKDQLNRTDATLSETGQTELMTYNPIRLRLMSLLGVKYILEHKDTYADKRLSPTQRFDQNYFTLAWQDEIWRIWEYKAALPRTFFATDVIQEADFQKEVDILLNPSTDLRKTLIFEVTPDASSGKQAQTEDSSNTAIRSYTPNEVEVTVHASTDGFLFLSDTFYPGWNAFVDGKKTPIYRADFSFRAVPVGPGDHLVRFTYDPASFKIGLVMSALGVISIPFVIIFFRRLLSR